MYVLHGELYILMDYINKEAGGFCFTPVTTTSNFPQLFRHSQANRK